VNATERNTSMCNSERKASLHPVISTHGHAGQKNDVPPVRTACEGRYLLRLANGQGWEFVAADGAGHWVEKLASIMELKRCEADGCPKLFFVRAEFGTDRWQGPLSRLLRSMAGDLPQSGWMFCDVRHLRIWAHPDVADVICETGDVGIHEVDISRMWQSLFPVYKRAADSGGLPLHAALVERNGTGVLLAAPGGTGKSTCCRRIPPPWKALCDDLTLAVADTDSQYRVHPFPTWSEYLWRRSETTWDVQRYLPLSAIVFLEQGTSDEMLPIGKGEAAACIMESASQVYHSFWGDLALGEQRSLKEKVFENACGLARSVPAFRLRVSLEGRFWEQLDRVLL